MYEYKLYRLVDCETGKTISCNWEFDEACAPLITTDLSIVKQYQNSYKRYGVATKIQVTEWVDM